MNCWICGAVANSHEHMLKASDVRLKFPSFSQDNPIYKHRQGDLNRPVGSSKSKAITFNVPICGKCNNERTQPYDRAWESLSAYLHTSWESIKKAGIVNLSKPFPGKTGAAALDVHLYFVKLFGCLIVEGNIPIPIAPLSDALLRRKAHPEISLSISEAPMANQLYASISDVETIRASSAAESAGWAYIFSPVAVFVGYKATSSRLPEWSNSWHPSRSRKLVKLAPYKK